jgi:hypothetical protein
MEENNLVPELKDLIEMIYRYCASNENNVTFVYSFIGFEKDPEHKCVDCGDDCEKISEKKSTMGAYGDLEGVRALLNDLRDMIEDEADEEGFVNV